MIKIAQQRAVCYIGIIPKYGVRAIASERSSHQQTVHDALCHRAWAQKIVSEAQDEFSRPSEATWSRAATWLDETDIILKAPLQARFGNGKEVISHERDMEIREPGILDPLRAGPTALEASASKTRLDLLSEASALTLGVEMADSMGAQSSAEKALAHEAATAHRLAMRFFKYADDDLWGYQNCHHEGRLDRATQSSRAAGELMAAGARALLTLERIRSERACASEAHDKLFSISLEAPSA